MQAQACLMLITSLSIKFPILYKVNVLNSEHMTVLRFSQGHVSLTPHLEEDGDDWSTSYLLFLLLGDLLFPRLSPSTERLMRVSETIQRNGNLESFSDIRIYYQTCIYILQT